MARMDAIGASGGGATLNPPLNFTGSQCTGSDGDGGRQLIVTGASALTSALVIVDTYTLNSISDFTFSGNVITFLNAIFDTQKITVYLYT